MQMQLYQHQIDGLKQAENLNKVAFYWDMGLGKTFAGSEKIVQLGAEMNLVVCQKSKIDDWYDHFTKVRGIPYVYDLTKKAHFDHLFIHNNGYRRFIVGIINYDVIFRRPELLKLTDFTLLLDESSLIQNPSANRTRFILKMNPKNVILLSGTPTGGKYEFLWTQMHLLGWKISEDLYLKQFVEVDFLDVAKNRSIPIVTGYKNVDRLKRKMAQHGCQFLKTDEVFDLPQQMFQKIRIPTSKEYKFFRKNHIVELDDGTELVGDTTLTRMLYERQLCGMYSEAKIKAFEDLLNSTEDRLIVFYNFTAELNALKAICEATERPYSIVNGSTKDLSAYDNQSNSVTFLQYQAGAMGLNLQKACRMVFFTLPLSSELYEQAKKRIHRIGQDRTCFYYQMICSGSREESILAVLNMRKDYTEELFEKEG